MSSVVVITVACFRDWGKNFGGVGANKHCEIEALNSGADEDNSILGCDAVSVD
jgi:hypothetical protein